MLRFILRRDGQDNDGRTWESFQTVDADVPELEAALIRGGCGIGWDQTHLVGVEVCREESPS